MLINIPYHNGSSLRVLVQDPLLRETPAAAARGALVVAGEPGPEVRGVAAVAALRAHCRGAGTRQPTQRAADRGAARAALLAHRARHLPPARRAPHRHARRVQRAAPARGETLEELGAGSEHVPAVEHVGVCEDVGVVRRVVGGVHHQRVVCPLRHGDRHGRELA